MLALLEQAAARGEGAHLRLETALRRANSASEPLRILAESQLDARFRNWRGLSGRRYVFSVYDARSCPAYENAVIAIAAPAPGGSGQLLGLIDAGCFPEMAMAAARAQFGEDCEFHVHLLAKWAQERRAVIADIAQARLS